jgi:metal-responsive CopG/Arc/MetJ family transcriptional regulator
MHTMAMVRTNITLPAEVLALVDEVAGPRGRSAYIADVVARQVRRDNARKVFRETRGALKGSSSWGRTQEEVDRNLREVRDSWDRDDVLWPKDHE